ncbi:Flavinator of succinate dehydrogenase [Kalmanozyma brasiliensis GHG001]|uniref:Succinate dehydrogenase assembly factor 2, mitochondrial n=1 Tax=Kalmanozyma brasiliensis (strain GHG001) TaxID=1365824 RepID=V5F2L9_KALBG|nr:Flavinator of succinate dehydrogenase [Kalmanozyma brasiliensis GHG001]EST09674.1 Flavinator of succinate dehydrogenase [Kalmanozyma brasiliensis GHG001]
MTLRLATSTLRRTVAATRAPTLRIAAPRTLHSSAILPKAPRGNEDQGPSGPNQTTNNASGPSGTAPDAQLSDPYPLPFSPDVVDLNNANSGPESGPQSKWAGLNLASDRQTLDGVDAPMRVPGREDEDRDTKVARLVYQCRKRGTLETDLLLSTFAKKELKNLPMEELDEFDRLLDEPDWDIFYWCTQRKPIPERWADSFKTEGKLGHRLIVHTRNEEKAVRWMPEL